MTSPVTLNCHKKNDHYVIFVSLKSELGKLINRIPGLRLLISSLPGSASRTLVDIKRHLPSILY